MIVEGERLGLLPVVGTTMCAYTDLVQALGGWQALPAIEDVALLLAVEAVCDGWMGKEPGLIYRRWDGSSSREAAHDDVVEERARRAAVLARVRALRALGWRYVPGQSQLTKSPARHTLPPRSLS